jgi:hypothetical protein
MKLGRCFNGRRGGTLGRRKKGYKYPKPPELAVMWLLRPGRVNRHGWPGHPALSRAVPGHPGTQAG